MEAKTNPYYHPADLGYELLVDEDYGWAYEPFVVAVFKRVADGKLFWDWGASCSCYDPMEDCTVESLKALPETMTELRESLPSHRDISAVLSVVEG